MGLRRSCMHARCLASYAAKWSCCAIAMVCIHICQSCLGELRISEVHFCSSRICSSRSCDGMRPQRLEAQANSQYVLVVGWKCSYVCASSQVCCSNSSALRIQRLRLAKPCSKLKAIRMLGDSSCALGTVRDSSGWNLQRGIGIYISPAFPKTSRCLVHLELCHIGVITLGTTRYATALTPAPCIPPVGPTRAWTLPSKRVLMPTPVWASPAPTGTTAPPCATPIYACAAWPAINT